MSKRVKDIAVVTFGDGRAYDVASLSEPAQALVAHINRANHKQADLEDRVVELQDEILLLQAAKEFLMNRLAAQVTQDEQEKSKATAPSANNDAENADVTPKSE